MNTKCLPSCVFCVAQNVDAAVVAVVLAQNGNVRENEFEFFRFLRQKIENLSRQKTSIPLVHARRRILK